MLVYVFSATELTVKYFITFEPRQLSFSRLPLLFCITMYLNVDVRQFRAILQFCPKLPHIHVQIHCNANEKS